MKISKGSRAEAGDEPLKVDGTCEDNSLADTSIEALTHQAMLGMPVEFGTATFEDL